MSIPENNCRVSFVLNTSSSWNDYFKEKYQNLPCMRAIEFLRGLDKRRIPQDDVTRFNSVSTLEISSDTEDKMHFFNLSVCKAASLAELFMKCSQDRQCDVKQVMPTKV